MACVADPIACLEQNPRGAEVVSLGDVQVLSLGDIGGGISFRKLAADEASTTVGSDSDIEGFHDRLSHSTATSAKNVGAKGEEDVDVNAWKVVCNRIFTCFSESDDEPVDVPAWNGLASHLATRFVDTEE
mmetsp:Transcript_47260/g.74696  ORF Transcript_47260/g.74696 Transcript_47260/m.74696 type:complete len:130 (+) Transcript_47260:53-442(+)